MENVKMRLSVAEISNPTGLSISMIRRLTRNSEIPHIRVGKRILSPVTEIEKWLSQNTITTTSTTKGGGDIES